jgi:hemin uptake protein HemP
VNSYNPANFRPGQYRPLRVADDRSRPSMQGPVKTVTSESLFLGDREIGIDHGGALYRLKITRQGKLILNK